MSYRPRDSGNSDSKKRVKKSFDPCKSDPLCNSFPSFKSVPLCIFDTYSKQL